MGDHPIAVSEVTRRAIFDELRLSTVPWHGHLDEVEFLSRLFDLGALPSEDRRFRDMAGDVLQHRIRNYDWPDDWVYSDRRLNLTQGPDETFLRFLAEMVHPVVRRDEGEISRLTALFNKHLTGDGYQIAPIDTVSGRRIYAGIQSLGGNNHALGEAQKLADALSSSHLSAQITRMQTKMFDDPALAIGSAKEFVESLCKGILDARRVSRTGKEDFPRLASMTREALDLKVNPSSNVTLRSMMGALGTITTCLAELRGQLGTGHGASPETPKPPEEVARLAVNAAMALGLFLWDVHRKAPATPPPA